MLTWVCMNKVCTLIHWLKMLHIPLTSYCYFFVCIHTAPVASDEVEVEDGVDMIKVQWQEVQRVLSEIVHSIEWRARGVQQYVHDNDTQDHWTKNGGGGGECSLDENCCFCV